MVRVMLVDDEKNALDLLEILLRKIGNVTVVGRYLDPFRALDALKTAPVDAVFLDIQMPGMIGTEVAKKVQVLSPETKIVFTTAYSEYAIEAFEIQSVDYLLKPFTADRLRKSVDRIAQSTASRISRHAGGDKSYIQCLGGFRIHHPGGSGRELPWKTNKEKELCAYLIHHAGMSANTSLIMESLWPESDLEKARTYLYTCISYLRKNFHTHGVQAKVNKIGKGYGVESNGLMIDAVEFEKLLSSVIVQDNPGEALYREMNALYTGEYMEGCDFPWAVSRREELSVEYIQALRKMHVHFMRQGNMPLSEDSLQRIMTLSPYSEKDGRELMKLYMNTGKRNEALKVYRKLGEAVKADLGLELEEATRRLYKQIDAQ